jgi:hypothetical protein
MRKSHFFALLGGLVLMFGGPAVGLFLTALRMRRAAAVAQALGGEAAARLVGELHPALAAIQLGLAVGTLGLILLLAAVMAHFLTRRPRPKAPPLWPE